MYLRLKSAGVFFRVLNTPARIEVLESMGDMDRGRRRSSCWTPRRFIARWIMPCACCRAMPKASFPSPSVQRGNHCRAVAEVDADPASELGEIRNKVSAAFDRLFG